MDKSGTLAHAREAIYISRSYTIYRR